MGCQSSAAFVEPVHSQQTVGNLDSTSIIVGVGKPQQGVHELKENYDFDESSKMIGSGSSSKVFKSYNKVNVAHIVAIKVIEKEKQKDLSLIQQENDRLRKVDHPGIVKYFETYDDNKFLYIVTEYIRGQNIMHTIAQKGGEHVICDYVKQILQSLSYLHSRNIIHRDIKPGNVFVNKHGHTKLIDFGIGEDGKALKESGKLLSFKNWYQAPDANVTSGSDIWSLGVVIYHLICGFLPFEELTFEHLINVQESYFQFNKDEWKNVSGSCKDLIRMMIKKDPADRWSVEQCLKSKWFDILNEKPKESINPQSILNLAAYQSQNLFKKAAMNSLIKMGTEKEVKRLRQQFQAIDKDGNGSITFDELKQCLKDLNFDLEDQEITDIISNADFDGTNTISYTEFLSATIDLQNFLDETKLLAAFRKFDTDNSGELTQDNIYYAMQKMGYEVPRNQISSIVYGSDINQDKTISYDEFKQMFLKKEEQKKEETLE